VLGRRCSNKLLLPRLVPSNPAFPPHVSKSVSVQSAESEWCVRGRESKMEGDTYLARVSMLLMLSHHSPFYSHPA
jgi:hypothetical protein